MEKIRIQIFSDIHLELINKLPIYEHLRIENMKSIDAICVNDADFELYNSIKNLLNKNQSSITLMNDK